LPISLQDAIDHLYDKAVTERATTSTTRLRLLADFCVAQLAERGLAAAETEVLIPGGGRPKYWDVAWPYQGKYRLAISLKSILRNLSGTVPNRIDELMGDAANVQMYSPEIVVGYFMILNVARDELIRKHGRTWKEQLELGLGNLSGRAAPAWSVGMVEASVVVDVDFSHGPRLVISTPSEAFC
jgi:hypothetical protein